MNPARIRHRIKKIEVNEGYSAKNKIYIDFFDGQRARWYVLFLVENRSFGVACRVEADNSGGHEITGALRSYLISIIPPDIIARCTAATLGIAAPPIMEPRSPEP